MIEREALGNAGVTAGVLVSPWLMRWGATRLATDTK
jgi:hypothetical protein